VSNNTNAAGFRVEIWDRNMIGSDDFMGYVFVDFETLKSDIESQTGQFDLKPREGKKDKVSGKISMRWSYWTKSWYENYQTKRNEEEAAQKKAANHRQSKIDEMVYSHSGCTDLFGLKIPSARYSRYL
jgi:hypothetical protein